MNVKNWKTSLLGFIAFLFAVAAMALVYFDKATLTEAGGYLGLIIGGFIMPLNSFLSKDHDKI